MPSSCSSSSCTLPLTIITLLILAFLSFTTFGHYHNGEPCNDDFSKIAKGLMSRTQCKKLVSLGAEFAWNYHNNAATTCLDILFRAKLRTVSGWVAWGVNPGEKPRMVGTRAIIAIKHSDGKMKMNTYNVTKKIKLGFALRPSPDIGIKVLKMTSWSSPQRPNLYVYISATLLLPSEKYNITKLNHVWQVGDEDDVDSEDQILRHKSTLENVDGCETIDLTTISGRTAGQSLSYLRTVHGVLNIIGWGTLLPSGVIIARYFRVFPFYGGSTSLWLHVCFQISGYIIGTVGWAIGLSLGNGSIYSFLRTHRTFGNLIFILSTIQIFGVPLNRAKYWNMHHHFIGYGLMIIIIMNIFKGISILQGGPGWEWTYIGILTLLSCIILLLEIITWARFIIRHNDPLILSDRKTSKRK